MALTITQPYGCTGFGLESARGDCPHFHSGVDIALPLGTPLYAGDSWSGAYVESAGWSNVGYGNRVVLRLADGTKRTLNHLSAILVRPGQQVSYGELVGKIGSTGNSTGPHLHFEALSKTGADFNPLSVDPNLSEIVTKAPSGGPDLNPLDLPGGIVDHTVKPIINGVTGAVGNAVGNAVGTAAGAAASAFFQGLVAFSSAAFGGLWAELKAQAVPLSVAVVVLLVLFGR